MFNIRTYSKPKVKKFSTANRRKLFVENCFQSIGHKAYADGGVFTEFLLSEYNFEGLVARPEIKKFHFLQNIMTTFPT